MANPHRFHIVSLPIPNRRGIITSETRKEWCAMNRTMTKRVQKIIPALGTINIVTIAGNRGDKALSEISEYVRDMHRRLSVFDESSEISEVNRFAGVKPVKVSQDTFDIIERSLVYSRITDGSFDITAGALAGIWKKSLKRGVLPDRNEIENAAVLTGFEDVILDREGCTVMLKKRGQRLDLGGVAKGTAADEAARILKHCDVTDALLNFGGTVVCMGSERTVGLRTPFAKDGTTFAEITVKYKAVVTSGIYEQYAVIGGRLYHHIVDPRTGFPADSGLESVTLVGDSSEQLDALATAIIVMGIETGSELAQKLGLQAVFTTTDGKIFVSDELKNSFRMK